MVIIVSVCPSVHMVARHRAHHMTSFTKPEVNSISERRQELDQANRHRLSVGL